MEINSDSDDLPQLSSATFAALQEFYNEQELREAKLNEILHSKETTNPIQISFDEDWQLSQFWYDNNTVEVFAKIVSKCTNPDSKIALVSCPTIYNSLKQIVSNVHLFEYDRRFAAFGTDFVFYDFKSPLNIPRDFSGHFDLVIADPPFLSEDCLTKTAVTIKYLAKDKILLCTGSVMEDLALRLLNVKKSKFKPSHKNNLGNEFACFSNFDVDKYL